MSRTKPPTRCARTPALVGQRARAPRASSRRLGGQQRLDARRGTALRGSGARPGKPAVEVRVAVLGAQHVLARDDADEAPVVDAPAARPMPSRGQQPLELGEVDVGPDA